MQGVGKLLPPLPKEAVCFCKAGRPHFKEQNSVLLSDSLFFSCLFFNFWQSLFTFFCFNPYFSGNNDNHMEVIEHFWRFEALYNLMEKTHSEIYTYTEGKKEKKNKCVNVPFHTKM